MQKVIYTYGAFDLLHCGHLNLLEQAKSLGDYLIVGILSDKAIRDRKGEDRPIQPQADRARIVGSLKCVDKVVSQPTYNPLVVMKQFKIDLLTKGDDWNDCCKVAKQYGCGFSMLTYSRDYSTSGIIGKIRNDNIKPLKK